MDALYTIAAVAALEERLEGSGGVDAL